MSCIGRGQLPGGNLQNPEPDCDKHFLAVVRTDDLIDGFQHLSRAFSVHDSVFHNDFGNRHKQGAGDAFSGNIGDDKTEVVIVDQEEIVKITAHFLCGIHQRIEIELFPLRERRKHIRKHGCLNTGRKGELCSDLLLFRGNTGQMIDIAGNLILHLVNGPCQLSDLVPVADHLGQLLFRLDVFRGKAGRLFDNDLERIQKHPALV